MLGENKKKFAPIIRGKEGVANGDQTVKAAISANIERFLSRVKEIIGNHADIHRAGKVFVNGAFYCTEEQWVHALRVNPL